MSNEIVSFHFTLRSVRGDLIDTSRGGEPVSFLEGAGEIIDGLEEALRAVAVGDRRTVTVPAAKAYGVRDGSLVQKVSRSVIPAEDLKPGDTFQTGPDRHDPMVMIVAIEGDEVTLDANHPLAGEDLVFDVEITARRAATVDEIAARHSTGGTGQ
jgi:FKBP-type peptidyl-prolyl cis-trans isomerase SlyD